jgi:transcriptional regulator with XRE-family HTH domain
MMDIGSQIRAAREAQGLTLEQAFKGTRIKTSFLEAIEANQFAALPGPVQARGFVRSYANYLGLDGEQLASALDAERVSTPDVRPLTSVPAATKPIVTPPPSKPVVQPPAQKPPVQPSAKPAVSIPVKPLTPLPGKADEPGKRTLKLPNLALNSRRPAMSTRPSGGLPTWVLIVGAVALFVLGVLLVLSALALPAESPAPGESNNVPNTIGTLPTTDRTELAASLSVAPLADGPVSITLKPNEHVWTRITIDGQTAFEGMLDPSMTSDWQASAEIIIETGNAAALTVIHQGQASVLGERGQIVARAWGHRGAADVPLAVPEVTPTMALTNTVQ